MLNIPDLNIGMYSFNTGLVLNGIAYFSRPKSPSHERCFPFKLQKLLYILAA